MINIIKHKKLYLIFSFLVLIPGTISLLVFGLNLAIDFTGGSVYEYEFLDGIADREVVTTDINSVFAEKEVEIYTLGFESDRKALIRSKPVAVETSDELFAGLKEKYSDEEGEPLVVQSYFETIGPSVGVETTKKSFFALTVASLGILLYIAYAFRNIPKPYSSYRFGMSAIIAMLHDAFIVLGVFSILGHFLKVEIDALFITAVLTVIGFSVHDTIVVFDRIRENLRKLPSSWAFDDIVNYSMVETLNRSLATSLTVIITLLALFLLGGSSIKYFTLALLIGIVSGTYSSIFTASPILVIWENRVAAKAKKKRI